MAVYFVNAKAVTYVDVLVEADSPEEAREFAEYNLDGSEFDRYDDGWEYGDVDEVTRDELKRMGMGDRYIYKANGDLGWKIVTV